MIHIGPGFLAVLAPTPHLTPLFRQQVVSLSQSSCVFPVKLTDFQRGGVGVGEEPNHTTRKRGPLKIIQCSLNSSMHCRLGL
jgi:hypothetical protein